MATESVTTRRQCAWWGDTTRCTDYNMPDSDYCEAHTRSRMRMLGTRDARWEKYTDRPESEGRTVTDFLDSIKAAVAKAAEIQTTMIVNKDRIAVRASTCDGHTHWCATGYGFTVMAVTADSVQLTARTVREAYRTGIELVGPDGAVVASDFAIR